MPCRTKDVLSLAAEPEPVAPIEPTAAPAPPVIDVPVEMRGEDIFLSRATAVTASVASIKT